MNKIKCLSPRQRRHLRVDKILNHNHLFWILAAFPILCLHNVNPCPLWLHEQPLYIPSRKSCTCTYCRQWNVVECKCAHCLIFFCQACVYLFSGLSIHLWHPTYKNMDFMISWLLKADLSSPEHQLARYIVSNLNWGHVGEVYIEVHG